MQTLISPFASIDEVAGRTKTCSMTERSLLNMLLYHRFSVELGGKISYDFFVDQWVDVLSQLVEDEPISNLAFVSDMFNVLVRRQSTAGAQQVETNLRPEADSDAIYQGDA